MAKNSDQDSWKKKVRQVAYGNDGYTLTRRRLGALTYVIGTVVGIILISFIWWFVDEYWESGQKIKTANVIRMVVVVGLTLAAVGVPLYRRLMAQSATELLSNDERQPVLYLRTFKEDETEFRLLGFNKDLNDLFLSNMEVSTEIDTFEYEITKELSRIGPVIAVGKPHEKMPPLGACRVNLNPDGESWKEAVRILIGIARLVVVRCNGKVGEGTLWELRTLLESAPPEKIILSLPREIGRGGWDRTLSLYRLFWQQTHALFAKPLPQDLKGARLLAFDADRNPLLIFALDDHMQKLGIPLKKSGNPNKIISSKMGD